MKKVYFSTFILILFLIVAYFLPRITFASLPTSTAWTIQSCGNRSAYPITYCVWNSQSGSGYTTDYTKATQAFNLPALPPCSSMDYRYQDIYSANTDCTNGGIGTPYACCAYTLYCETAGYQCPTGFNGTTCPKYYTDNSNQATTGLLCKATGQWGCCLPDSCTGSPINGQCVDFAKTGGQCPSGYAYDSAGANTLDASCSSVPNGACCQPQSNFPNCTNGTVCQTCNASAPPNTCGTFSGNTTCTNNATQPCNPYTFTQSCTSGFIKNCSPSYTCVNGNTCVTNIYAYVYIDYNHTASNNGGGLNGVTVTDNGGNYPITGTNGWNTGEVVFSQKATGTYTITADTPTNWYPTSGKIAAGGTSTSNSVSLTNTSGNVTTNFYVTPLYNISGNAFLDTNKNQKYDATEQGYGGGTISITGGPTSVGPITVGANGTWAAPTNLLSGNYTVTYSSALATGYSFTTPSSWAVTVGNPAGTPACNTGGSLDATCGGQSNGSISNLNFGVTNENTWTQTTCMDVRNDSGTYTDLIPAAPSCGGVNGSYNSITNGDCSTGAGIIYSCDATPDFGLGSANANNWQSGGPTTQQQECFVNAGLNVIRTSYEYLLATMQQSGITPTDMATVCGAGGLANCTLPATLAKGVYLANGDVYLNTYTFPVDPNNPQGFIFLINGNLHIEGNILIPRGSVAAFAVAQNIYVDKTVGQPVNATTLANGSVNDPNIEGLYTADSNFTVESYGSATAVCNADGTPVDLKLNVIGSVITNAAKQGGSFIDNRDLCVYDLQCPAFSGGDGNPDSNGTADEGLGLSYILTLFADGNFLNHQVFNWQELQP